MSTKRTWLAYSLYGIALAIFFLYYLFPVEALKNYAIDRISRTFPQLSARIERARLILPLGLRFENVSLYRQNSPFLNVERVTVKPGLLSLIRGKKSIYYDIRTSGGRIDGDAILNSDQITINTDLDKIRLEEIPALHQLMPNSLSGLMSGKLSFRSDAENKQQASASLNVIDSIVQLAEPFLNIDSLTFNSVTADMEFQDRTFKLTRCVFRGEELNGDLSGTALFKPNLNQSTLNLSGKLLPNAAFLQSAGADTAAAFLQGSGKNGFPIKIIGTLSSPKVTFN